MNPIHIDIGLSAISSYRRMNYEFWYALAEFVDNSTQSYANNRVPLLSAHEEEGESLEVRITYERRGEQPLLRIVDNAMGMDYDELQHALRIAAPPANPAGRCRYGMGMKTAACWIGNRWLVVTKKLGDTKEYSVEVDVARIESGDAELRTSMTDGLDPATHYTRLEVFEHHREFKGRTIGKVKDYLQSMYRQDFESGGLSLYYNDQKLEWPTLETRLRLNAVGERYKKDFAFDIDGKAVRGWAGILERGKRSDAGFSIFHADRVVFGWPDAWRPVRIFGEQRNDLLNQRLVGEIHLDDFEVTHTKDNIQWYGDDQERVEEEMHARLADLIGISKTPWKNQVEEGGPTPAEFDMAIDGLREELLSPQMVDKVSLTVFPEESDLTATLERIAKPVKSNREPDISAVLDKLEIGVYVSRSGEFGPNDPYVVYETSLKHGIVVIINRQHPHLMHVEGQEGLMNYFRHCVYDAVAEWQAQNLRSALESKTIKMLKDNLLRVSFEMEQRASEEAENAAEQSIDEEA